MTGASRKPKRIAAIMRPCPAMTSPASSHNTGMVQPHCCIDAASCPTCVSLCWRELYADSFSAAISRRSILSAGHVSAAMLRPLPVMLWFLVCPGGRRYPIERQNLLSCPAPSALICRMIWIDRPSVDSNLARVSTGFDLLLCAVVTVRAERLQFAVPKQIRISSMGFDVIGNACCHHNSFCEAEGAERLCPELRQATVAPARIVIQVGELAHSIEQATALQDMRTRTPIDSTTKQ